MTLDCNDVIGSHHWNLLLGLRNAFLSGSTLVVICLLDIEERCKLSAKKDSIQSIRVTLETNVIERIDALVGRGGRQRFIRDAILWRLDRELPPIVMDLAAELERLKARVEQLENLHSPETLLQFLNDVALHKVCRDDLDRRLLRYFVQHEGATTPELAEALLGSVSKRRTVLDRIDGLNKRAEEFLGVPILTLEKGLTRGKRGAWWLINQEMLRN
ncbi:MAG: hypothetical protein K9W43_01765 [Candidatus Thorarchaeota archaeon]|nr:hypothetical protein [Candidatus Thorarchaeota archaeon]